MVRVFWFPSGLQYAKRMGLNPVLDRASILFIKSEFHCGRFAPLRNSSIISVGGHRSPFRPICVLTLTFIKKMKHFCNSTF